MIGTLVALLVWLLLAAVLAAKRWEQARAEREWAALHDWERAKEALR